METEVALARRRLIIIIVSALVFIAIVVGLVSLSVSQQTPKTGIKFIVAPDDISVTTGSKKINVSWESVVAFVPGSYDLTLKRNHFSEKKTTVVVKQDEITQLYIALDPSDDIGRRLMEGAIIRSHAERIAGQEVKVGAEELTKKYTFVDKLPIARKYFVINPCIVDDKKTIGICIDMAIDTATYRADAMQALVDADIDASQWVIRYNNNGHSD